MFGTIALRQPVMGENILHIARRLRGTGVGNVLGRVARGVANRTAGRGGVLGAIGRRAGAAARRLGV